ncbi:NUDIX hydrolase [Streptomyces qinzhouensis]|uniref:NUDIX hydrolase n=1 Tax=Streptomyces qinzhouensis TaxID=2599401 RepID=A0A5B8JKG8_9ACTN|nr:NUDIX hydrolase [Streptomyces qinzhouensis]QDY78300.1 NUDIX hydrolase [Streptomyces qinzhouensis]
MTHPVPSPTGIAAAVITRADGRVLIVRRRVPEGELLWQFPGGKIEEGESAEEAAVREARQETALKVSAALRIGSRLHPQTGRYITYIGCTPISGRARVAAPREISRIAWIEPKELDHHIGGVFETVRLHLGLTPTP